MDRGSTLFLKCVILVMALVALALAIWVNPWYVNAAAKLTPGLPFSLTFYKVALYLIIVPLGITLYQAFRLLVLIDRKAAFSGLSVIALKSIKLCAAVVSILLLIGLMPPTYLLAQAEDAPGLVLMGMAFSLVPLVISTFAAVLQRLLREAIAMKSENELTV